MVIADGLSMAGWKMLTYHPAPHCSKMQLKVCVMKTTVKVDSVDVVETITMLTTSTVHNYNNITA